MQVRRPAVAGAFYPADPGELKELIRASYLHRLGPGSEPPPEYLSRGVVPCLSPHAGYVYSGPVAAHTYFHVSSLRNPELVVIVGPNHYAVGRGGGRRPSARFQSTRRRRRRSWSRRGYSISTPPLTGWSTPSRCSSRSYSTYTGSSQCFPSRWGFRT